MPHFRLSRPLRAIALAGVSPDELASVYEIAEMLGVSKRTAARYVDRPDFPPPFDTLAVGRIWRRKDVERWAKATLPLKRTGRPRKERT